MDIGQHLVWCAQGARALAIAQLQNRVFLRKQVEKPRYTCVQHRARGILQAEPVRGPGGRLVPVGMCVQVIQAWHDPLAGEIETRAVKGSGGLCEHRHDPVIVDDDMSWAEFLGIDIDDLGVFEQQLSGEGQIPPDLVVKTQPLDIAEVIL
jgi:hypothetical protein